jgi:hypothetical protein
LRYPTLRNFSTIGEQKSMTRKSRWLGLALITLISGCGSVQPVKTQSIPTQPQSNSTNAATQSQASTPSTQTTEKKLVWPTVQVSQQGQLPVGVVGNALALDAHGRVLSVGGYTGRVSVRSVEQVIPNTALQATLPLRTHDAAVGYIGSDLYVFGGGQSVSYSSIVRVQGGQARTVGHLGQPLSDATSLPYTWKGQAGLLLIGGYNGSVFSRIVQFVTVKNQKLSFTPLFTLPVGLRYTAVASAGDALYIVGGKTPAGSDSAEVYRWTTGDATAKPFIALGQGLEKAAVFTTGKFLIVVGGLDHLGNPLSQITAVNEQTGKSHVIGKLPKPLADMGNIQINQVGYVAGGFTAPHTQGVSASVYRLQFND